jgi:hypothetical protein
LPKCIRIERTEPRPGGAEFAVCTKKGYQLRRGDLPEEGKNRAVNAFYVDTLDEAIDHLRDGCLIRMGRKPLSPCYIKLPKLRFIY